MNKEELLKGLKDIQRQTSMDKLENFDIDARVEEFEEIAVEKARIVYDIKYLTEKLQNDENYRNNTSVLYNESRRFNIMDRLKEAELAEQQNLADIAKYESSISSLGLTIKSLDGTIAMAQRENLDFGVLLRSLGENPDPVQEAGINETIEKNRKAIAEMQAEKEATEEELETAKENLEVENAKTEDLQETTDEYDEILENFDRLVSEETEFNEVAKEEDRKELEALTALSAAYNSREQFLAYDYSRELSNLITDVENGNIEQEEVLRRVEEFKNHIPQQFLVNDVIVRDEELVQNKESQTYYVNEIAKLEEKLSNEDNYAVSQFIVERNNDEVKKIQARNAQTELDILRYTNDNIVIEREIAEYQALVELYKSENLELGVRTRSLGVNIDPEEDKEISEQLESNRQGIAEAEALIVAYKGEKTNNDQLLEISTAKKERYTKVLAGFEGSLEQRNSLDKHAMRLDKDKLSKMAAGLEALKNREAFLNNDLETTIDEFIAKLNKKSKKTGKEEKETKEEKSKATPFVPLTSEEVEEEEKAAAPITPDPEVEPAKKEDEKLIPVTGFKKAKKTLLDKIKNKPFMKKLARWAALLLMVIMLITNLHSCKNLLDKLQGGDPTPPTIEQVQELPSDIQDEINDLIAQEGDTDGPVVDVPEETDKPDQTVTPTPEPTPEPTETPKPEVTPQPTPEVTPEPTPEITPEVIPEPIIDPIPEPIIDPIPEPIIDPIPEPIIDPIPEPTVDPQPIPDPTTIIEVNEGETLILGDGTVFDNSSSANDKEVTEVAGSNTTDPSNSNSVEGVTYDSDGSANVEVNTPAVERDHPLTQAEIDAMRAANGITSGDVQVEIEMQRLLDLKNSLLETQATPTPAPEITK